MSFWLDLRCSGGTAERRETACRRQPAGQCKASATPLRVLPPPSRLDEAKNSAATRHFVIFSQVLNQIPKRYQVVLADVGNCPVVEPAVNPVKEVITLKSEHARIFDIAGP